MPALENPAKNKLYYGDNLAVLSDYIPAQSVDLIYLDPPFNSRQDSNGFTMGYPKASKRTSGFLSRKTTSKNLSGAT
jgi:DNA modification methylase